MKLFNAIQKISEQLPGGWSFTLDIDGGYIYIMVFNVELELVAEGTTAAINELSEEQLSEALLNTLADAK